jgi:hypothetical protein
VPIEREISVLMVDSDPRVGRAVRPVVHVADGLSADCEAGGAAAALAADGRRASDAILADVAPTMAPEGIGLIILSLRVGRLRRVLS